MIVFYFIIKNKLLFIIILFKNTCLFYLERKLKQQSILTHRGNKLHANGQTLCRHA